MTNFKHSPKNQQVNRRRFLRMAATTAAAVMTVSAVPDVGSPDEENPIPAGLARYAAELEAKRERSGTTINYTVFDNAGGKITMSGTEGGPITVTFFKPGNSTKPAFLKNITFRFDPNLVEGQGRGVA